MQKKSSTAKLRSKILSIALVFVLVLGLAACGSSDDSGSDSEGGSDESFSVGFALRTTNGAYYATIGDIITEQCAELGWECTVLDANDDTTTELENMETLTASGVDLIFLDCVDPSAATASQQVAYDAGSQ